MDARENRVAWYKHEIERMQESVRMMRSGTLETGEALGGLLESRNKQLIAQYERTIDELETLVDDLGDASEGPPSA